MQLLYLGQALIAETMAKLIQQEDRLYDAVAEEKSRAVKASETTSPITLGAQASCRSSSKSAE